MVFARKAIQSNASQLQFRQGLEKNVLDKWLLD